MSDRSIWSMVSAVSGVMAPSCQARRIVSRGGSPPLTHRAGFTYGRRPWTRQPRESSLRSLDRPRYLRLLTIILVLLIAAAAAYAVFMRPLEDLVVNSGALVLGVWGIRGILTPGNLFNLTAVDLALSIVIIFLLGAITVRALMFLYDRAEIRLLRRRPRR